MKSIQERNHGRNEANFAILMISKLRKELFANLNEIHQLRKYSLIESISNLQLKSGEGSSIEFFLSCVHASV